MLLIMIIITGISFIFFASLHLSFIKSTIITAIEFLSPVRHADAKTLSPLQCKNKSPISHLRSLRPSLLYTAVWYLGSETG